MDVLEEVLSGVAKKMKDDLNKEQEALDALAPHFENEADALAYAKRLMALKPGDVALTPDWENKSHRNGVFIGTLEEEREIFPEFLVYDKERKRFGIQVVSWMGVTLKD